jgi:hypothetical protein
MKAKEKAEELYDKYFKFCNELSHDKNKTLAKLMAITCVDEILKEYYTLPHFAELYDEDIDFLLEVKEEIYNYDK